MTECNIAVVPNIGHIVYRLHIGVPKHIHIGMQSSTSQPRAISRISIAGAVEVLKVNTKQALTESEFAYACLIIMRVKHKYRTSHLSADRRNLYH